MKPLIVKAKTPKETADTIANWLVTVAETERELAAKTNRKSGKDIHLGRASLVEAIAETIRTVKWEQAK